MNADEEYLSNQLREGKESAYKKLFDLHYSALCLFAYQYVKDRFAAETIVSDVFFNLWQKREDLQISQSIRSYLLKAVKNRFLNYQEEMRNRENLKEQAGREWEERQTASEEDSANPLARLIEKELDLRISESLEKLPGFTREIFELSRFSGLKYQEIAEKSGVSVDTVKYHIKQALSRLREELRDYFIGILFFIFIL
ncbi:RNA polymerase sigma-70 factor [Parabacteroides sp. Marseille-P3160]|uniref:RNA polymerase sigma-70 factor n=1 Tax=Parabacteroides sp. Marseille-P3160 TaxID=1917887 RepID=UPI0009BAD8A7|nr:RNA polymerase sigma-70 factor [Parabacteroides sp. Marseille-P3160]